MTESIHLIHTNDLHSHFENWPKIRRFLLEKQNEYVRCQEEQWTVDLGDFMDRSHPLTEATNGLANVDLMNQGNYNFATIGNNEGITNNKMELNELYKKANFSIILSNLKELETDISPKWAKEYEIVTTKEGTRIGFIALTSPMPLTYEPFGWHISFADDVLPNLLNSLTEKVDVVILLSHLGIREDKEIAKKYPEIDVIIESHTHHLFEEGLMVNGVLLASAGKFGEYVGEVVLMLDKKKVIAKSAVTYKTDELEESDTDSSEILSYMAEGRQLLEDSKVAYLPHELEKKKALIIETLESMKKSADCDVAIVNSGLFLENLEQGVLTKYDLHGCLPHPMNLIKVSLLGRDVIRLVYEMEKNRDYLRFFHVVGMKFRGNVFGEIWYDGLTYKNDTKNVLWHNQEIDENETYHIVTVDHLAFLPFFPTIEIAGDFKLVGTDFLRTVVGKSLAKKYPI